MTTFQAIVYAIFTGVGEFLPISAQAHHLFFPFLFGWQSPTGALLGALTLGTLLALLLYYRHDWASMISCFIQVILYRKKPMTLDERLPLFLTVTTLPFLLAAYYAQSTRIEMESNPLWVAGIFAVVGIPLWFTDTMNRKNKGMFDWKGVDAFIIGISQILAIFPGWDNLSAILMGAFFLNYRRESAAKYAYFALAPILAVRTFTYLKGVSLSASAPMADLSWLSFTVAIIVSCLSGLLAIGAFNKHIQQKGLGQYIIYRWIFAAGICVVYWTRNYGS